MRCGARWGDASILNISCGGLGMAAAAPPQPGAYVELRRGAYVIVARVVWASGERFGLRAQDSIAPDELVAAAAAHSAHERISEPGAQRERRHRRRTADRLAASRMLGRAFGFICVATFGAALAVAAADGVTRALAQPLAQASESLGPT
jgi:hypothetical protein